MDSLEECGIRYMTAGSVAMYRDNPAAWVMQYLFGIKSVPRASLARLIAVKEAAKAYLYRGDESEATDLLMTSFEAHCWRANINPMEDSDARDEYSTLLELFASIVKGINELQVGVNFGKTPLAAELASSFMVDGLEIPILGSPDFTFDDMLLQLKPGKMCYQKLQDRDVITCSILHQIKRLPINIIYATYKKHNICQSIPTSAESIDALVGLVRDAVAIQTMVKTVESREHALAIMPLNPAQFRWSRDQLTSAREILAISEGQVNAILSAKVTELRSGPGGDASWDLLQDS